MAQEVLGASHDKDVWVTTLALAIPLGCLSIGYPILQHTINWWITLGLAVPLSEDCLSVLRPSYATYASSRETCMRQKHAKPLSIGRLTETLRETVCTLILGKHMSGYYYTMIY